MRRAYKRACLAARPGRGGRTSIFPRVKNDVSADARRRRDDDAEADAVDFEKALHLLKGAARPLTLSLLRRM